MVSRTTSRSRAASAAAVGVTKSAQVLAAIEGQVPWWPRRRDGQLFAQLLSMSVAERATMGVAARRSFKQRFDLEYNALHLLEVIARTTRERR